MNVCWVRGYEGSYLATDTGQIISMPKNGKMGKVVKLYDAGNGYLQAHLSKNGSYKTLLVHRIIAECFCPNPELKPQVNHIDGNKKNNSSNNLEWCTQSENERHKYDVLGVGHKKPSRRMFTDEQVRAIREDSRGPRPLARIYGVSPNCIRQIKKHISYQEVE